MKKSLCVVLAGIILCSVLFWSCDLFGDGDDPPDGNEAPDTPSGLAVSGTPTADSIMLTWLAVSDALGYRLYRASSSGGSYSKVGSDIAGTTATDTGLTANTPYYYKISAYNNNGESTKSSALEATTAAVGGGHDGKTYVAKIGDTSYTDVGFPDVPDDARFFTFGPVYVGSDNYVYNASSIPNKHFSKNTKVPVIPADAEFFSSDKYNSGIYFYIAGTKLYYCNENDATPAWTVVDSNVPANTKFFNVAQRLAMCADTSGGVRVFNYQTDYSWSTRSFLTIPASATTFYGKNRNVAAYADAAGVVYLFDGTAYTAANVPAVPVGVRTFSYEGNPYVSPLNSEAVMYIGP